MNKYDDKTLDVNLEAARKMATMGNLAIKAATEKENFIQASNVSLFEPGALGRVTRLAKQLAEDETKVYTNRQECSEAEVEEIEIE